MTPEEARRELARRELSRRQQTPLQDLKSLFTEPFALAKSAEAGLPFVTGAIAEPIAGLAGLATLPFAGPKKSEDVINKMREMLTVQPFTQEGQERSALAGEALAPVGRVFRAAEEMLGRKGFELGGPMGGAIGETLPTIATLGLSQLKVPIKAGTKAAQKFTKMGFKVLPKSAKQSLTQDVLQGTAGTVPLKQVMSVHNQKLIDSMVRKEFGLLDDMPLDPTTLNQVRATAGQVYNKAKGFGQIKPDAQFINSMNKLKRPGALAKEFPDAVKKDLIDEVNKYNVRNMTAEGIIEASKQLRRDFIAGSKSLDPQTKNLARIQGKIANTLESLLERRVQKVDPIYYPEFKNARQTIAKTYSVEKALKDGSVDAVMLGKELTKGAPFSGTIKDIAEFGRNFREVAQVKPPQTTEFRPMDIAIGGMAGIGVDPSLVVLMMGRPALRRVIMSKKYQGMLGKLNNENLNQIINLPKAAQASALTTLLEE